MIGVPVCSQVEAALKESPNCPPIFRQQILRSITDSYDKYEEITNARLHLTGTKTIQVHLAVEPWPVYNVGIADINNFRVLASQAPFDALRVRVFAIAPAVKASS
ncbi:hypothetical protein HPB50_023033 [Hyalomma asiaticum]|uniref:Uncharacterized protein n=1 Tax=Hyalomma asiaticum TaxID=266040 RepID=A0ACB7SK51_HYAAI|nr:hypothetical protein HPB50_023033 [Hyalomma asiaticum]